MTEPKKKSKGFIDWIFDGDEETPEPVQDKKPMPVMKERRRRSFWERVLKW
jgi:hypothetical protein